MSDTRDVTAQAKHLLPRLKKMSVCVYLAAEAGPAADLSDGLRCAVESITALLAILEKKNMVFQLRWRKLGGHIHCRVFQTTAPGQTWQKNGDLVYDEAAWSVVVARYLRAGFEVLEDLTHRETVEAG